MFLRERLRRAPAPLRYRAMDPSIGLPRVRRAASLSRLAAGPWWDLYPASFPTRLCVKIDHTARFLEFAQEIVEAWALWLVGKVGSSGRLRSSTNAEDHPSARSRNVGQLWGWRGWFACASSRKLVADMGNAAVEKGDESDIELFFAFRDDRTRHVLRRHR